MIRYTNLPCNFTYSRKSFIPLIIIFEKIISINITNTITITNIILKNIDADAKKIYNAPSKTTISPYHYKIIKNHLKKPLYLPQHFLYFLSLPHGHRSFLPIFSPTTLVFFLLSISPCVYPFKDHLLTPIDNSINSSLSI